jgi:glycosyltransferase involved in cell wall biosynthesis
VIASRDLPTILDVRVLSGSGGGPDKTIIHSPPHLASAGYRMLCAYLHDPADAGFEVLRQKAADVGTPLISIVDRGPLDWRVVGRLLEVCRRENVDVWHGHDYKTNALGLLLRLFHPMRLVTTVHGWVYRTRRTPLYYFIDRLSLRFYERVICVSEDLLRACYRAGVSEAQCVLIENGIDITAYRRTRPPHEARAAHGLPDVPTVGAMGRLSAEKGFDILIRAVDQLLASGTHVQLVIAGEGPERASLDRLVAELGRRDAIRLLGYRNDLVPLYESMDVYALSSYREGLPNVVLEAMAMDVPVVATRIDGLSQLIRPGVSGEIVEPGSVVALAEAIGRVLRDPLLRDMYAAAGRRMVEERHNFTARMAKLASLYEEMQLGRKQEVLRDTRIHKGESCDSSSPALPGLSVPIFANGSWRSGTKSVVSMPSFPITQSH